MSIFRDSWQLQPWAIIISTGHHEQGWFPRDTVQVWVRRHILNGVPISMIVFNARWGTYSWSIALRPTWEASREWSHPSAHFLKVENAKKAADGVAMERGYVLDHAPIDDSMRPCIVDAP